MKIVDTSIPDVKIIQPLVRRDDRGYFFESYKDSDYQRLGLTMTFVQENQALSERGVLRGLHYQLKFAQGKLVRVPCGKVLDVAVDLRRNSPTFSQWVAAELSDENHHMMYIPEGFAHGYQVISETAVFQYKCTEVYHPEDEYGIIWNDENLKIEWNTGSPLVSAKDRNLPSFSSLTAEHLF